MLKKIVEDEFTFSDILLIPGKSKIELAEEQRIDISSSLTPKIKLNLPVLAANMSGVTESDMAITIAKCGGIGIIHQFMSTQKQIEEVKKVKAEGLLVGAAVFSYGKGIIEQAERLEKEGCDVVVIDSANAYNERAIGLLKNIRKKVKCGIIIGNIATIKAIPELVRAGADAIKIGIGPGSHCTTRIVTGFGRPQLSLVLEAAKVAKKYGVPLIADGGITSSGDMVKALALGADTVMVGGLLVGTKQSPGSIIKIRGKLFKRTFGNCTEEVYQWRNKNSVIDNFRSNLKKFIGKGKDFMVDNAFVEEGVAGLVEYKGDAEAIIRQFAGGIRRGFWYGGALSLMQLQAGVKFVKVTQASLNESYSRI